MKNVHMDLKKHTHPDNLEKYSFLWSEARLVIAAAALFLGGVPPLRVLLPLPSGLMNTVLTLSWIVSGAASAYLLYRWATGEKTLFGKKQQKDTAAFFVSAISGLNLGLTGLTGTNIGMSISSNFGIFLVVGVVYLFSAYHLFHRWKESGRRIFT